MTRTAKVAIGVVSVALLLAVGVAVVTAQQPYNYGPFPPPNAPSSGATSQPGAWPGYGPWGMMGPGWMHGGGMMGYWGGRTPSGTRLTLQQAKEVAQQYAKGINTDLEVAEVMEFNNHFYAEVREKSTGIGAFEILIDPITGSIGPEPGPNMMWNLKYGHMSAFSAPAGDMPVGPDQAVQYAQQWLDAYMPGYTASREADRFYGYYTVHVEQNDKVAGMLSVNGYSGQVWYHAWHGAFVGMIGEEEQQ